ncbi:class I SAM-dependent methyltransferase [Corynebacterium hindlerae]|uniref:class I SAM-dependent methyltransferase n=1 Tax=Corynebacterium hindlerae TaxID=699041 RepID=UPI001AD6D343|nr:class I SAM-dependent methyltransferase [Corynebacterium hindlerae]QTH59650.1 class I SAM-dependent methyltransferase [Corynebacterium hindlerae]
MPKLHHTRRLATLGRSLRLLRSFPKEQTHPDEFYHGLAADTFTQLDALHHDVKHQPLTGAAVLDVGGGPGYFGAEFAANNCSYISVEPSIAELHSSSLPTPTAVRADGQCLPFATSSFDLTFSSNVAEHIPDPWRMGEEMLRVTRPGGLVVLSYTIWLGPFGGHETGLWQHYVGGAWARDRYSRVHGKPPKNVFGESLFDVSCAEGIRWAQSVRGGTCVGLFPRYHPRWAWWLVKVPVVREFLVSNLVIVIQKNRQI